MSLIRESSETVYVYVYDLYFMCVYYEKNHLSIPALGLATAAALIDTTSFS